MRPDCNPALSMSLLIFIIRLQCLTRNRVVIVLPNNHLQKKKKRVNFSLKKNNNNKKSEFLNVLFSTVATLPYFLAPSFLSLCMYKPLLVVRTSSSLLAEQASSSETDMAKSDTESDTARPWQSYHTAYTNAKAGMRYSQIPKVLGF